jgi:GNAT superfamily N-acetyltransferase
MHLTIDTATETDVPALVAVRAAAAERLTHDFGHGHWSLVSTEAGVRRGVLTSRVLVARTGTRIAGTLRLATKRPWAIDAAYFAPVRRPLYLVDMAVDPSLQRQGVGRQLCDAARLAAREWPADALRLDAYDHAAGAGTFYAKCGFREVGRVVYRNVPLIYFEAVIDR